MVFHESFPMEDLQIKQQQSFTDMLIRVTNFFEFGS